MSFLNILANVGVDVTKSPLTQAEIYSRSIPTPDTKDTDQHEETSFDQLLESSPNTFKLEVRQHVHVFVLRRPHRHLFSNSISVLLLKLRFQNYVLLFKIKICYPK